MDDTINKSLVEKTLEFHGLPLIKTWNEENGANSLNNLGIQVNFINTSLYQARLKNLSYTDRTKRMKLHHFICSRSAVLFENFRENPADKRMKRLIASGGDALPPMEYFSNINRDERINKFFSSVKAGDIAYGIVLQGIRLGVMVKVLCTVGSCSSLVPDLNIKGIISPQNIIPAQDSSTGTSRQFLEHDYVCCEVLDFSDQNPQLNLGMLTEHERYDNGPNLGLISIHQLPNFYKLAVDPRNQEKSYNKLLTSSESFDNPSIIENLLVENGLPENSYNSFMSKSKFPQDEYAKELRQQQASKLAFRSVAEGINFFKQNKHSEAFQCLNKALSIDPRNVEGLVARGALFANSGTFNKAIVDFEEALKINPNHANAKKYLGETLLALGRSYEEDNKFEEAQKTYIDCLNINPHHQEALASLNYIKTKINARKIVEPAELELPPLNIGSIPSLKESKRDYHESSSKSKDESRSKKSKKDKKKKGKKRHSSSSDSSSESSSESTDSSSESSDNSSSTSDSDSRSKKKDKKRKSLSPISKRMDAGDSNYHYNQSFELDDHELKVKKFLEMGKDEDDYEDKVGQLIAEASKYQRSKQAEEAKQAKKKKKSEKKMKKEKKKRKKDDKKKSKGNEIEDLREALKMFENLPEKIKKLYQEKMREEEAAKESGGAGGAAGSSSANDEGKWKMKFSKDERQGDNKKQTKNFSLYESDDEDQTRNFQSHAPAQTSIYPVATTSTSTFIEKKRSPVKQELPPNPPIIPKGPVVLDKFGNFRLAEVPQTLPKPADSTKRSRSRSRRSRTRSDSRSPRRRRSSSYRRRHSRSRSYSRSYSRSPNRNSRGGRGFGRFDRSRQRYSPRGGRGGNVRGRWNDNFNRDSRGGDFRRNDRFDRDRPRGGGNNRMGGNRFNNRYDNRRSFSRSPVRSPAKMSPERKDRWAEESMDEKKKTGSEW